MLKVHAKRLDAVEVLSLEGKIVNGETEILRTAVGLASATRDIILDLANVSTIDAHGLGVLLHLREQTLARGVHFELTNVSRTLNHIFEITRLDTVFQISSDVQAFPQLAYAQRVPVAA